MPTRKKLQLSQESTGSAASSATSKEPKESPFAKKNQSKLLTLDESKIKKRRVAPECKIICIETESDDLCGFAMYCDHYAETAIFNPFYQRHVGAHVTYMTTLGAVPLVFDLKTQETGMTGTDVIKRTPGMHGGRLYNMKGMVVMTPMGSDDDDIQQWFEGTFIPALRQVGQIEEHNVPTLQDPSNWRRDDCWSETLLDRGWTTIVRNVGDLKDPRMSVEQVFKAQKSNYTAIYTAGNAPAAFLAFYHMTADNVYPADVPNLPNTDDN